MNLIKDFRELNRTTLPKADKTTIAVITKFDEDSKHIIQHATELFGPEVRYVLLCIYSLENALAARSHFPSGVKAEVMEKLQNEQKLISYSAKEAQPEILIEFAFGSWKQVIENGWNNGHFHVVVMSTKSLGWFNSIPSKEVPILTLPPKNI